MRGSLRDNEKKEINILPNSRTLIALPLNGNSNKHANAERMEDMKAVFDYYKPSVEVGLQSINGEENITTFKFNTLSDFTEEGIIGQSKVLQNIQHQQNTQTLIKNLTEVFEKTNRLEKSYRSLDLFFKNTSEESLNNLYTINVPLEEFTSSSSDLLYQNIDKTLAEIYYNSFSTANPYSIMVIPGYLEFNLNLWSKIAHKHKVTLITDYKDATEIESIKKSIEEKPLKGLEEFKSNTIVTCNYGLVREKISGIEKEDMYIPLSIALAGKMYRQGEMYINKAMQPIAGRKSGKLDGIANTRIDLKRVETIQIEEMGMIPIKHETAWGVCTMSDLTLYADSSDPELGVITTVRTLNWIQKSILIYLNAMNGDIFSSNYEREMKIALRNFFKGIMGRDKLIEDYDIMKVEQDRQNFQKIDIEVQVKLIFSTKYYDIKFQGNIEDDFIRILD